MEIAFIKRMGRKIYIEFDSNSNTTTFKYHLYFVWFDLFFGKQLIQRRFDGSENFSRNWSDYEKGFGSSESEFWLGRILDRKKKSILVKLVVGKIVYRHIFG